MDGRYRVSQADPLHWITPDAAPVLSVTTQARAIDPLLDRLRSAGLDAPVASHRD